MHHHDQAGVTDAAFAHLAGIATLNIAFCIQITDAAFAPLAALTSLNMCGCNLITDAAFERLTHLRSLNISNCTQANITGVNIKLLTELHTLRHSDCTATISDVASRVLLAERDDGDESPRWRDSDAETEDAMM